MAPERESQAREIGDDVLAFARREERRRRFVDGCARQQGRHALDAAHVQSAWRRWPLSCSSAERRQVLPCRGG